MTEITADEALLWLRAYHAETLDLALRCASEASEMARAAHDIQAVPEEGRSVQAARYKECANRFEALRKKLAERAVPSR
jgi:Flp pilus assembly protein CpaB